jgi:hypothetical protein
MRFAGLVLPILTTLLIGCSQRRAGEVIARVGNAELTLEDAQAHIDSSHTSFDLALNEYVAHWVNTELLYQEAKHQGVESSEQFVHQFEDIRRQLANQAYLDRTIYSDTGGITPDGMQGYFREHASEFLVHENTLRLNLIALNSREGATAFAAAVSRGAPWKTAADSFRSNSAASSSVVSVSSGEYYTSQTLFPPELWKVASALSVNEVSFPVKTTGPYFVLQLLSKVQQGAPADFDLARPEVRQRLLIEGRRKRYDDLLGTLRRKYGVQVMLGSHRLTDTSHVHE